MNVEGNGMGWKCTLTPGLMCYQTGGALPTKVGMMTLRIRQVATR